MFNLAQLRKERAEGEKGFTLIELLVVVVIIGILIAIAIPLYLNYQKGAKNKAAQSDTRNAVSTVEQCASDNDNTPPATADAAGGVNGADLVFTCGTGTQTATVSNGDTLTYANAGGVYTITGKNKDGGTTYTYVSNVGKVT